jgi:hypothetical protein
MPDSRGDDDEEWPDGRTPLSPSARSSARLGLGHADVIAPGLVHSRVAGYVRMQHVEPIIFAANSEIQKGYRVLVFVDGDDVHGYETEVRKVFQTWAKRNRASIQGVWVLFRSPLVKMGLNVASAFTGGLIRGYVSPEEFERAITDATRRAKAGEFRVPTH